MSFNWHEIVFKRVLNCIAKKAQHCGINLDGWYVWFESTYPEVFKKYQANAKKLNNLWGKNDPKSMDEFKKLSKEYEDVYKWVIDKYVEHIKLKGKQEALPV